MSFIMPPSPEELENSIIKQSYKILVVVSVFAQREQVFSHGNYYESVMTNVGVSTTSQVIEFQSRTEADFAYDCIFLNYKDSPGTKVTKLYRTINL